MRGPEKKDKRQIHAIKTIALWGAFTFSDYVDKIVACSELFYNYRLEDLIISIETEYYVPLLGGTHN